MDAKARAAAAALAEVTNGMRLGLGTGSTARLFIDALGRRVKAEGLDLVCVPTSEASRVQADALGLPLTTLDETPELDLAVDGADEIGPGLSLVKGGGGALTREKIVAAAARRFVVIADDTKLVGALGAFPLPVEVLTFGYRATAAHVARAAAALGLAGPVHLRERAGKPFVTDNGNLVLDASFRLIPEPEALAERLAAIPGVVEHGLFLGLAARAYVARSDGVRTVDRDDGGD